MLVVPNIAVVSALLSKVEGLVCCHVQVIRRVLLERSDSRALSLSS